MTLSEDRVGIPDVPSDFGERLVDVEVRMSVGDRALYATDSSNYRQVPQGLLIPRTVDAAVEAVRACEAAGLALTSRGGGTSLAGQTTNSGIVLDWSKHCNRLVEVDEGARTCVVEPGISHDDLNDALEPYGLMFGPKPATHRTCTLGGMIGNNSCGSTAQAYGKTVDNVRRLEILTYDGERMWVGPTSDEELAAVIDAGGRRGEIYGQLRELRDLNLATIRTRYPDIPRRVSGYNLDSLLPENGFDLARTLVGSEGTLVVVLHAELDLVPIPKATALVVLGYPDIATAADAVPHVLEHDPWQLEGLDDVLVRLERTEHIGGPALGTLPRGAGWLFVKLVGDTQAEADAKAEKLVTSVESGPHRPHVSLSESREDIGALDTVREQGLGATAHPPGEHETWEGWEDSAVPPERLGDYLRDLRSLMDEFGFEADETSLYGHFGQGCVHTRIPFELRTAEGIGHYRAFAERAADLVVSYGGSLSGEHGDGQSRGELLPKMFGEHVVALFGEVKRIFDPGNRMNPGKIVDPNPLDGNLRLGTGYRHPEPMTYFSYPKDEHRFSTATLRCVGIGSCRSTSSDEQVMCPSYMVTREEKHSTRGRARLLFEMIRGDVITDGWRSREVAEALDLCLSCKGCRSDCPVEVDMATYKAEFLAHHHAHRIRPRAHYSMGWLPVWARLARHAPRAVNAAGRTPVLSRIMKWAGGIDTARDLPAFARRTFVQWSRASLPAAPAPGAPTRVLVWPDTFTNAFHPDVGVAGTRVLRDAGFDVAVPTQPVCCGLTWISTGQLATARRVLRRTARTLREDIRAGTPIVVLEPSCAAALRSDAVELCDGDEDLRRLSKQVKTLAEFLAERAPDWQPPRVGTGAIVQTHCHQHAVLEHDADDDLMKRAGIDAERLGSGCCGLAGNFGFERGHYDISVAIGERVLLPRVRTAAKDTAVLADGFSCRTQIAQADTGREALHLAQLLAQALDSSPSPEEGS